MPLIITVGSTPAVISGETLNLDYSTYLGGSDHDYGQGICLGTDGRAYVTGYTSSSDFPTKNSYQSGSGGDNDVFVSALSSSGSALYYSTYIGGSGNDRGYKISMGTDGTVYLTGATQSSDFPTENPYQAGFGGNYDVFVSALSSTGSALFLSTYLGGNGGERGHGIKLGTDGRIYVAGNTIHSDFPTKNPYQARSNGGWDIFVTALSATGSALSYSTYLGGSDYDFCRGLCLDTDGRIYVTGFTYSSDFPTKNPYQARYGGGSSDAFVSTFSSTGETLFYSTYLGGSSHDYGQGICLRTDGAAYITGNTWSSDFPTKDPYQAGYGGDKDAFVTALSATGSALSYSTYLGGSDDDWGYGICLGTDGAAYATGYTYSSDFPTKNPYQGQGWWCNCDIFVTALSSTGSTLSYSTYLGGSYADWGQGICLGTDGAAYITGYTNSFDFPTKNPYQAGPGGVNDAFVCRLTLVSNETPWITDYNGDGTSDIAIFRASSGLWAIREITRIYFGMAGDNPQPGDYNGNGTTDIGLFRPSSGLWALRGISRIYFGGSDDDPIPADYDGNGTSVPAIFRPSSGLWAARGVSRAYFGGSLDEPIPGYYSGLGHATVAIYRPSSGLWAFRGLTRIYFGTSTDDPVPGDYNGDGGWRPGIFRPSSGLWALVNVTRSYFGGETDQAVPGIFSGDGTDDIAIFKPSSGLWAVQGITRVYFGGTSDIPVTR